MLELFVYSSQLLLGALTDETLPPIQAEFLTVLFHSETMACPHVVIETSEPFAAKVALYFIFCLIIGEDT